MKAYARNILLALGGLVALAGITLVGFFLFLNSMTSGWCGVQPLSATLSPDARHQVVTFEYDCGATTDFSTQVSLLQAGAGLPNRPGNVIGLDAYGDSAPRGPGGGPIVRVKWLGIDSLEVSFDQRARVLFQNHIVHRVRISYTYLVGLSNRGHR